MIHDCPSCLSNLHVSFEGFSVPDLECDTCGERFRSWRDWVNLTPLVEVRRKLRRCRLRGRWVRIKAEMIYLSYYARWLKIKIEFWRTIAGIGGVTPEQSEALTGIEVEEDDN